MLDRVGRGGVEKKTWSYRSILLLITAISLRKWADEGIICQVFTEFNSNIDVIAFLQYSSRELIYDSPETVSILSAARQRVESVLCFLFSYKHARF